MTTPQINPKYQYQLETAENCLANLKVQMTTAKRWMIFWMIVAYSIDSLMALCLLCVSINFQTNLINEEVIQIVSMISLILKALSILIKAQQRGTIAGVVQDNYSEAVDLIGNKVADLKFLANGGVLGRSENKTWNEIVDYINNIINLSKKWPSTFVVSTNKVESISSEIAGKLTDESDEIEKEMNDYMTGNSGTCTSTSTTRYHHSRQHAIHHISPSDLIPPQPSMMPPRLADTLIELAPPQHPD